MTSDMRIVDCHCHVGGLSSTPNLAPNCDLSDAAGMESVRVAVGADRMNVACTASIGDANSNPVGFLAKAEFPERFYVFAALDHSAHFGHTATATPPLAEQVDLLRAAGADGMKMIETKPNARRQLAVSVDSGYYDAYFARVQQLGLPLLWHVADPEEFWEPERLPPWARDSGWGYDDSFVTKEQLYREVENLLARYPGLKVIFPHFFFLSADLPRASALLDRYEHVHFDLAPGVELLYNLSVEPMATHDFFVKYAARILFGTDNSSRHTAQQAQIRSGIVSRWLQTEDEFRMPDGADFLLGAKDDGVMRGIGLPEATLQRIYHGNFERLVGAAPRPLDRQLAAAECERLAEEVGAIRLQPPQTTLAAQVAERLRASEPDEQSFPQSA